MGGFLFTMFSCNSCVLVRCVCRYLSSPALLERSELVRTLLRELNIQYFLVALFSSVPVFLPKSNIFSNSVLKIIFGGGETT